MLVNFFFFFNEKNLLEFDCRMFFMIVYRKWVVKKDESVREYDYKDFGGIF